MRALPPLDMHAHIDPHVGSRKLEDLGAVVFAVTRSPSEFSYVRNRTDQVTVWGIGCHPGETEAHAEFDIATFREAMTHTPFVGEIGLDGRSGVSKSAQEQTFRNVLDLVSESPRLVSIHSSGATANVLDLLEASGARGVILHWWLGSPMQTARALELGCYFSINYAMAYKSGIRDIPVDRILIETDHPFGDRRSTQPRQPGSVAATEDLVSTAIGVSPAHLRRLQWVNFATLVDEVNVGLLMPTAIQRMLTYARTLDA